jgi:hypothetical protein
MASALHENGVIDRREYADIISGKECDFFNKIVLALESVGDKISKAEYQENEGDPILSDVSSYLDSKVKVKIEPTEIDIWLREKAFIHDLKKGVELNFPVIKVKGKALLPRQTIEEIKRRGFLAEEVGSNEHNLMQGPLKIRIRIPPQGM